MVEPGRALMSKSSVIDSFFDRVHDILQENDLLDQPTRIYNIDETWFTPNAEKSQGVINRRSNKMPFKVFPGAQNRVTLTMCI